VIYALTRKTISKKYTYKQKVKNPAMEVRASYFTASLNKHSNGANNLVQHMKAWLFLWKDT